MKIGFYPKLAMDGLRKNRRMTLPYLLTCIGMVMMFYIVAFLHDSQMIRKIPGGTVLNVIMGFGTIVIGVFAALFLFYTNSFLMRRRRREFGLYNVLGMGKRNIARILCWETLFTAGVSLSFGLAAGIVLSKLAELGLVNIMNAQVNYTMSISIGSIGTTLWVFGAIFLLLLLNSIRQVRFSGALELLRSENVGEKPPRANWGLGLLGVLLLGAAYYLAVTIKQPITAMIWFFGAVIMVIVATYLLMISGSVLLCRILQKNRRFYYKSTHFVATSSMAYRMKRNGAGLASICILATMVMVMISSTASLFFGMEESLHNRYPRDINNTIYFKTLEDSNDDHIDLLQRTIEDTLKDMDVQTENVLFYRSANTAAMIRDGVMYLDYEEVLSQGGGFSYEDVGYVLFLPLSEYNRLNGTEVTLGAGEALAGYRSSAYTLDRLEISDVEGGWNIVHDPVIFPENGLSAVSIADTLLVVLPDDDETLRAVEAFQREIGSNILSIEWKYLFDVAQADDAQIEDIHNRFHEMLSERSFYEVEGVRYLYSESLASNRTEFYSNYGGLFYLGIILSIVFIAGAVLMIYYKQISEGYEDQARFDIMGKVGMTRKEIRRSINVQLLLVFFLPLIFAGLHMAFAFPMVRRLLLLFELSNAKLFALVTVGCFVVFALFYTLVYRVTSNAYYNIVSEAREK